ncbi:hypothetical protein NYP20_06220 [Pseudomonas sp. N3-W]|jgi:hypothetical protein|uniref:Uncharacterized protein n=1 Tax=Pseudomonas fungipugnans TaxID=3024217 RepID=A0ABT6QTC6_9PSED|nr:MULTISPECIES: hypothetical protein [unclassified Pseudomonas]MDI2594170.1 hypothetical protein [Pseudomonas sp. 681]UWF50557.1 hypothetical protein NYP20_06220 [Pseudomonas sp. N3-W]
MSYQLTINGVIRLADSAFIPLDEGNRDWLDYLEWVSVGGESLPVDSTLDSKQAGQGVFGFLKRII